MSQRFTLDQDSFEQFVAAASLFQSLKQAAPNRNNENQPPLLQYSLETLRAVDSGTLDLPAALERVAGLALQIVGGDGAVGWLFTSESLICRAAVGTHFDDEHIRTALRSKLQSAGAFGSNPPSTLDLTRTVGNYTGALGSSLTVALLPGGSIAGALAVFSDPSRTFTERNYANLRLLAGFAQYVVTKWAAGQERESLDDSAERSPDKNAFLGIRASSSMGRSARAPFISRAPHPEPIKHEPIADLHMSGAGTHAALNADSNNRPQNVPSQIETDRQHVSTSTAQEGLDVTSSWHNPLEPPPRKSSPGGTTETSSAKVTENSPALQSLCENQVFSETVESRHQPQPRSGARIQPTACPELAEGAQGMSHKWEMTEPRGGGRRVLAQTLQRWETWKKRFKSRRDDRVVATLQASDSTRHLNPALEAGKNILRHARNVRPNWGILSQAAPALAILAVMSFFVGLLMGGRRPLAVGSMNSVAQAAAEPISSQTETRVDQPVPASLVQKKSAAPSLPTSHLQITDRETAATIAEMSKYELRTIRRAADYGDDQAALELGMLYELGRGFPQSCTKAATWVANAAQNGNPAAEYNLGLRYRDGDGVSVDLQQSEIWLRKAAAHKNSSAQRLLAQLPSGSPPPPAR